MSIQLKRRLSIRCFSMLRFLIGVSNSMTHLAVAEKDTILALQFQLPACCLNGGSTSSWKGTCSSELTIDELLSSQPGVGGPFVCTTFSKEYLQRRPCTNMPDDHEPSRNAWPLKSSRSKLYIRQLPALYTKCCAASIHGSPCHVSMLRALAQVGPLGRTQVRTT